MEKLKEPNSMDECLYFTNRTIDALGKARAWVFRPLCEKCKKGVMGKPVEKGKIKIRATEFVCNNCGFSVSKEELEPRLTLCIDYKCPHCAFQGQATTPYKKRPFRGVPSYVFECGKCKEKIGISKKMKAFKKGKKPDEKALDDDE